MELEEEARSSDATTTTAKQKPNFGETIPESCPVAAVKSENARNLTPILTPRMILETACSPENQRHRRKFSSLISQEQQQFLARHSSGPIKTPSRLTVQKRPSSSAFYSPRVSSSSPFFHHPIAQSPAVSAAVSPLYPTSDLGSSLRSSLSAFTTAGPLSASSSITDGGGGRFFFSKEMTSQDAAAAAAYSAGMLYSPAAPFSPFIVSPNEDAVFQSPTVFRFEAQKLTQQQQRPYFSFDPKSPSFLLHSTSTSYGSKDSGAILQEKKSNLSTNDQRTSEILSTTLIGDRERSRSDSDVINSSGQQSKFGGTSIQPRSNVPSLCSLTPSAAVQKKIFKKQILERYQTEIVPTAHDESVAARGLLSSSCSPLLAQLSFFPQFSNTAAASAGDNTKNIQNANFFDLLLPRRTMETESQADKTLEQCSILEFMFKNSIFTSLAFRQDSAISSSSTPSSMTLSPFRVAAAVGKTTLSSSEVAIFNRAPCLTLPTTPVSTKIYQSSSVEDNVINKRSRSESDMSQKSLLPFRSTTTGQTLASMIDESQTSSTTTIKSHKCAVCQKAFGRSDMLTRHMRLHTGIKPYACRVCGQVFSRSDHLSTHQRTHTGEKPYHCPQCTYSASRRDMITRHMRTHLRQRLGASTSMSGIGGNSSSSAPSASFDSSNCESTTHLSYYSPKIDCDFSREFQHVSVIRRINSAKDLYDNEDVTGLIHIEEMTTVEDKIPNSIQSSPAESAQASTTKNLNFSSIDRPNAVNLAVEAGGGGADECCSVSSSSELSTNESRHSSYPLYKRHFREGKSEKAEGKTGCSTAGGQSGINIDMEKPTASGDFTRML